MERETNRKRSRSYTGGREEPRTPCEKTPPTKRHTRSQSRKGRATETSCPNDQSESAPDAQSARNLTDVVDLILEEEEEEERIKMSKADQDIDADNIQNLTDMAKFFQDRLSALPTTEYLDKRLSTIERKTIETADDLKRLERRVQDIEKGKTAQCTESARRPSQKARGINEEREEAFLRAIRSVRIWPIGGSEDLSVKLDDFLKNALCMTQKDLDSTIIR